jgi:cephalosporin hydroxylase
MDFEKEYQETIRHEIGQDFTTQDIEFVSQIVSECKSVVELGTGQCTMDRIFLRYDVKLDTYDIEDCPDTFLEEAKAAGRDVTFHKEDTLKAEIPETDLLFIDSFHSYEQVKTELELHASKAKRYIVFHDTILFSERGQDTLDGEETRGILSAIEEFLESHPEWNIVYNSKEGNGMIVVKKLVENEIIVIGHNITQFNPLIIEQGTPQFDAYMKQLEDNPTKQDIG